MIDPSLFGELVPLDRTAGMNALFITAVAFGDACRGAPRHSAPHRPGACHTVLRSNP